MLTKKQKTILENSQGRTCRRKKKYYNTVMCSIQELSELTVEITNAERGRDFSNMPKEMADVYIVLELLKQKYNITDKEVSKLITAKLNYVLNDSDIVTKK